MIDRLPLVTSWIQISLLVILATQIFLEKSHAAELIRRIKRLEKAADIPDEGN